MMNWLETHDIIWFIVHKLEPVFQVVGLGEDFVLFELSLRSTLQVIPAHALFGRFHINASLNRVVFGPFNNRCEKRSADQILPIQRIDTSIAQVDFKKFSLGVFPPDEIGCAVDTR